ncbi:MAG: NADH-quinone oxidoreductase subunit J family protein [Candidatus Acidiferrales bacterium]
MLLNSILFYFFAGLAVVSAILMVTRRNVMHSAVFLITSLIATAGIYLQLQAEFLFVVQLILFVGGIMVLFVFVIMLVNLEAPVRMAEFNRRKFVGAALALAMGAEILLAIWIGRGDLRLHQANPLPDLNTEAVADAFFRHSVLAFELVSILLLAAMVGAVVLAKRRAA